MSQATQVFFLKVSSLFSSILMPVFKPILHLRLIDETALMRKKIILIWSRMVANLPIEEFEKEGIHVLRLGGRLDATSAPLFERKLVHLIETPGAKVVVDLKGLIYLSSAGMRVMLSASKKLKALNGVLVFSAVQEPVMELLRNAGFHHILKFFPTELSALKALKNHKNKE